jgi:nicotinamidase-related amidase
VKPRAGEEIVVKSMPSSFVKTNLDATLKAAGIETLVVTGLATHMCIDNTTRDAVSCGYKVIVVDDACASRDLPGPGGSIIPADVVHNSTLAALGDRFADIMRTSEVVTLLGRCSPARRRSA